VTPSRRALVWAAALGAAACGDELTPPGGDLTAPAEVQVRPLGMHAIGLEWIAVNDPDVISYEVQRRANFRGPFQPLGSVVAQPNDPTAPALFFDHDLESDTYYGYRVVTMTRFGGRSAPSTVRGARTSPPPGILVTTRTQITTPASADGDGYVVSLMSDAERSSTSIGLTDARRFNRLAVGPYQLELSGVAAQCRLNGEPTRGAEVTDVGVNTVDTVLYEVSCRDPNLGTIVALVQATGDSLDPNGYTLSLAGILADETLPDSQRAVTRTGRIPNPPGGTFTFESLAPGDYDVQLEDVADHCRVDGPTVQSAQVTPLRLDTLRFLVSCEVVTPVDTTRPFIWRNRWSADSVAPGQPLMLSVSLDLRAAPAPDLLTATSNLTFDPAAVRFDSIVTAGPLNQLTANLPQPNVLAWVAYTTSAPPRGEVPLVRVYFTAVGVAGTSARTRTAVVEVAAGDGETLLDTLVRVVEDTLFIRTGASANSPPTADAGGPYAGTAGVPVTLSGTGSSDADGSLASYGWTFGDGQSGGGQTVSHSYAQAGTYTATLTVTDDDGATDTDQATVTIVTAGNQSPVAQANGPYAGTVGTPIGFSAAGSADPDGTIVSYGWAFGDGGTGTGLSPQHSYAAAGAYTAILTVTDDDGATDTAQAAVTVSAGSSGTPLTWAGAFGAVTPSDSIVALVLTLDLTADVPETAGPEQLASWVVDSLKWNPAVLQYFSFTFGAGAGGSVNPTFAAQGKLSLTGALPVPASGVVAIGTVRFKVIGGSSATVTTLTRLGPVRAPASLGSFDYRPRIAIAEATLTVP
jgi:PKD repeat protein